MSALSSSAAAAGMLWPVWDVSDTVSTVVPEAALDAFSAVLLFGLQAVKVNRIINIRTAETVFFIRHDSFLDV